MGCAQLAAAPSSGPLPGCLSVDLSGTSEVGVGPEQALFPA